MRMDEERRGENEMVRALPKNLPVENCVLENQQ